MQVLSTGGDLQSRISMEHNSGDISCANSAISIDCQEPPASNIGEDIKLIKSYQLNNFFI